MSFSMKPQVPSGEGSGSSISNEEWSAWNEYQHNLIGKSESPVEGKDSAYVRTQSAVGILNFIMDMGFQPQPEGQYDTKCALPEEGEEYSQEELAHKEKWPTNDFIWVEEKGVRKRKQTSPKQPEQEYAFFFDFPEIKVDWTKHPNEEMHVLGERPLRVSYNGRFTKDGVTVFANRLPFRLDYKKNNTLSAKNPINKIAAKMGVANQYSQSGYDLGELAGKACKWTVVSERNVNGSKTFYNTKIRDAAAIEEVSAGGVTITVEQQIPECPVPFTGVFFDAESYDEGVINYVKKRKELVEVVKRAKSYQPSPVKHPDFFLGKDFINTNLAVALGEVGKESKPEPSKPVEEEKSTPEAEQSASPVVDTFDDDIPF